MLKINVISTQTHHFPIILLYITTNCVLELVCAHGVCKVEILYNDATLLTSSQIRLRPQHVGTLKWAMVDICTREAGKCYALGFFIYLFILSLLLSSCQHSMEEKNSYLN